MSASGYVPSVTTPSIVPPKPSAASIDAAGAATPSATAHSALSSYHSPLCGEWL